MKNSLFKRAFATVAAVPVALAQCLTIANAVEVTDADDTAVVVAAESSVITLTGENGLLSIAPEKDYTFVGDGTYEKVSDWNSRVAGLISQAGSGSYDASELIAKAVEKAGKYKDLAEMVADKVGVINYTVTSNGDLIITADVENVATAFESKAQEFIEEAVKDIVIEYDQQQEVIDELRSTKFFSDVDVSGTFKAVIKTADLATSTTVTAEVSFIDADGNEYKNVDEAKAYVEAKLNEIKSAAKDSLKKIVDKYDLTEEEIEQKIEESQEYIDLIDRYSQPVTLTPEEVEAAAKVSNDYKNLVADLVAEGMTEEAAKAQVESSQDYKDIIEKYSQKEISLTAEEVVAAVKKSEDYKAKSDEIKADYAEQIGILTDKLNKTQDKIDNIVDKYAAYITKAENLYNRAENVDREATFASTKELLAAAKNRISRTRYSRFANRVPESFEAGASTNLAGQIFTAILKEVNSTISAFDVQIDAVEIGKYIDTFQNIEASVSDMVATASAVYPDADEAAVKAYFVKEYGISESDTDFSSHMEIDATADFTNVENGVVSVDFQLKRVVKATPVTTTTKPVTTTSTKPVTTTTEPAVVTTTSDETPGVSTTTSVENPGVVTTTSAETPGVVTTTSAETPGVVTTTSDETPGVVTTTSDETPGVVTTTASDETPGVVTTTSDETPGVVTTTSDETPGVGTTTTVTETERAAKLNSFTWSTEAGYYLNIDDEYDIDQVVSIYANVQNQIIVKDNLGNVLETVDTGLETINMKGKINYGTQKPSDAATNSVLEARNVEVYVAEDVANSYGVTILTAGDLITNTDGERLTVEAYVGVKGDINLDGVADASDASQVLNVYAQLQTNGALTPDDIKYSPSIAVESASDILDQFAAFLADVDAEDENRNHFNAKSTRIVDASDASYILAVYAKSQTDDAEPDRAMWNDVLGK